MYVCAVPVPTRYLGSGLGIRHPSGTRSDAVRGTSPHALFVNETAKVPGNEEHPEYDLARGASDHAEREPAHRPERDQDSEPT